jgi:hypothetical protein
MALRFWIFDRRSIRRLNRLRIYAGVVREGERNEQAGITIAQHRLADRDRALRERDG